MPAYGLFRIGKIILLISLIAVLVAGCTALPQSTFSPTPTTTSQDLASSHREATPTPAGYAPAPLETKGDPEVMAILDSLTNLPLPEFFDESYKQLLLRSPQTLTELGLSASFGQRDDQLNDLSDAFMRDTQALEAGMLEILRWYDRSVLSPDEQISYDVYTWYLESQVRGHAYAYYEYPLHHFLGSWQFTLQTLFTEKHPLQTLENAEDYVMRLEQVERQANQLLEGLEFRTQMGLIPPKNILLLTKESLLADLQVEAAGLDDLQPDNLAVYTRFRDAIQLMDELTPADKQALDQSALQATADSVIPAYRSLLDYLDQLLPLAGNTAGAGRFPDGEAYYTYLLNRETSTALTPAEAHEIGLQEVARLQAELGDAFSQLGYPENESFDALIGRAVQAAGFYDTTTSSGQEELVEAYENILAAMHARLDEVFLEIPVAELTVEGIPYGGGGFYEPGSLDGARPGVFYAGMGAQVVPKYNMATIAYHEGIPGHHLQISLAQEAHLPLFRNVLFFNGYGEGWAVYSERLAWEMGFYAEDPFGNIGRLQLELLRAARLVADTGIHAKGWTRDEAVNYLQSVLGGTTDQWAGEVDRYIVRPGQASGYLLGMIEILRMRSQVSQAMGEDFDIRDFHSWVLNSGSLPLEILSTIVEDQLQP